MSVHEVDDVRAALDDLAGSIDVPNMLPLSGIAPMANRRSRRHQVVGGLATVLLAVMVTVGVGIALQDDTPSAVFAGQNGEPLVPVTATNDGDRVVGLATSEPVRLGMSGDVTLVVVTSDDGERWDLVEGADEIMARDALLRYNDGVFHLVTSRTVETVGLDGTTAIEHDLVHATSTDLTEWDERIHALSAEFAGSDFDMQVVEMAFVDGEPIALVRHFQSWFEAEAGLEAMGHEITDLCDFQASAEVRVRLCGETEFVTVPTETSTERTVEHELVRLGADGAEFLEIPVSDDGRVPHPLRQFGLYQTSGGVGIYSDDVFESTNARDWEVVDVGRESTVRMAARGQERLFRSAAHVRRYQTDDPVTGMGFSDDGGETWMPTTVDDLFVAPEEYSRSYTGVMAVPEGWVVLAARALSDGPQTAGVERLPGERRDDPSTFSITAGGYVLAGETPYGPAELRDSTGVVLRTWENLEVANPVWSGLEMVDGDVIVRSDSTDDAMTIAAKQWQTLIDALGPATFDVLFSPDGLTWSIIDTSTLYPEVVASTADGLLVQRLATGNYSVLSPHVELIPFPDPPAS